MKKLNILIVLLSFFLLGADSPDLISYPPQKIMGFRGLDTRSTAPMISDSRAISLKNIRLSEALDLRQRYGYDTVNDQSLDDLDLNSPAITGIFDTDYSDDTSNTLVFLGDKLKYDDGTDWREVGNWWVEPLLTAGQDILWKCVMAFDSAVCTNNTDEPIKVSSTPSKAQLSFTGLSNAVTKANDVIWYRNYLVWGNTTENSIAQPSRFRWSDVGTIETYQDDNFVDIATFAGDQIIGFAELYGDLYVFMTRSIWQVSLVGGDDVFIFKKIIDGIGSISRESIRVIQLPDNRTAVIFLTERKRILQFNGFAITDIGEIIQPTLDNLSSTRLQYAVSTFDRDSYFVSVTDGSGSTHDLLLEYNTKIGEWSKHTDINANAMAQVEESQSLIKTYFGNYNAFVYWLDNSDLKNDVDGAGGIVDSVGTTNLNTYITGAQVLIDSNLASGLYSGAIVKIVSGTAADEERVILDSTGTSLVVTTAFSTTPDSTSVYTIGAIDAEYKAKWYDLGNSNKEKAFLGMLFWAEEASSNNVDVTHAIDFGSNVGSETVSLSPSSTSLWDSAIWDTDTWGTTGDKIYTVKYSGFGNFIQPQFSNDNIDESFHLYGFNILATEGDTKQ